MQGFTVKVKAKQHHERKMTSDEYQEHLKMCKRGASKTKNGKRYNRRDKYPTRW